MEERFQSFEQLFETMTRGNEVVFEWEGRRYCLFAHFTGDRVTGYLIGAAMSEGDLDLCRSADELSRYRIGDRDFREIVPYMTIIERTI